MPPRVLSSALILGMIAALGCQLDGTPQAAYCYEPPTQAFAPRSSVEAPVWTEPPHGVGRPTQGVQTLTWLPWDYNTRAFYPVQVDAPVVFRMRFMVGRNVDVADVVRVAVFVEGRSIPFNIRGVESTMHSVSLTNSFGETTIEIAPARLQPGLNQVDVAATYRLDGRWTTAPTNSFTVANGSLAPQSYDETTMEVANFARDDFYSTFTDPMTGRQRQYGNRPAQEYIATLQGDLEVSLHLRAAAPDADCDGGFDRSALVAIRDGEPATLGELDRVVYSLRGGEQRAFRYSLPLWDDEDAHTYMVLALSGLGRPVRRDDGGQSASTSGPWSPFNF